MDQTLSREMTILIIDEQALAQNQDIGMQWHSAWQQQRGGITALATSYLRQALKPTVAITYIALVVLSVIRVSVMFH